MTARFHVYVQFDWVRSDWVEKDGGYVASVVNLATGVEVYAITIFVSEYGGGSRYPGENGRWQWSALSVRGGPGIRYTGFPCATPLDAKVAVDRFLCEHMWSDETHRMATPVATRQVSEA